MLIDADGKERIRAEIFRILDEIGLKVETEEVRRALVAAGCANEASPTDLTNSRLFIGVLRPAYSTQSEKWSNTVHGREAGHHIGRS